MAVTKATWGEAVILSNYWLKELREAPSAGAVVAFASAQLERMRAGGSLPPCVTGHAVDGPEDVREIASELAHRPFVYDATGYDHRVDQQLLILFSLATDRLAQFEGRGVTRPVAAPVIRAP